MEFSSDKSDLWVHILAALGDFSSVSGSSLQPVPKSARKELLDDTCHRPLPSQNTSFFSPCVRINVLECCDSFAVIEWNDPTGGHYAEQRWQRCITRRSGICALSGESIVRGDCIYQPARRVSKPVNSSAMILARALPILDGI